MLIVYELFIIGFKSPWWMMCFSIWNCCEDLLFALFLFINALSSVLIICLLDWQALVDSSDMVRSQMNFKRLSLTDIKIDIKRVPKKKVLVAAMEAAGVYSTRRPLYPFDAFTRVIV